MRSLSRLLSAIVVTAAAPLAAQAVRYEVAVTAPALQLYINGRDSLPYDAVFAKAGISVARNTVSVPFLGIATGVASGGGGTLDVQSVTPDQDWAATFRSRYRGRAGQPLAITVRRGGQVVTLNTVLRERSSARVTISRAAGLTPKQRRIWQGLASGL